MLNCGARRRGEKTYRDNATPTAAAAADDDHIIVEPVRMNYTILTGLFVKSKRSKRTILSWPFNNCRVAHGERATRSTGPVERGQCPQRTAALPGAGISQGGKSLQHGDESLNHDDNRVPLTVNFVLLVIFLSTLVSQRLHYMGTL